jgi:hypothetical protein
MHGSVLGGIVACQYDPDSSGYSIALDYRTAIHGGIKGGIHFQVGTGEVYWTSLTEGTTDTTVPIGQWTHIAAVAEAGKQYKVYFNGDLVADWVPMADAIAYTSNNRLLIGYSEHVFGSDRFFNGKIDKPAIYNRALTQNEIINLYNQHIPPAETLVKEEQVISDTGEYVFDRSGITIKIIAITGGDTLIVELYKDVYPLNLVGLINPLKKYFRIIPGQGITSIKAMVTFEYSQDEFLKTGLSDEKYLYNARYHNGRWAPYYSFVDTVNNTVTCTTSGFSMWAIDAVCQGIDCSECQVTINSTPPTIAYVGSLYSYPVLVSGGSVRQLLEAPAGMELDANTLSWVPTMSDRGGHSITIWANGLCKPDTQKYFLTVEKYGKVLIQEDGLKNMQYTYTNIQQNPNLNMDLVISIRVPQRIGISIYTAYGEIVKRYPQMQLNAGTHKYKYSGSLTPGIYFIKVAGDNFTETKKVLLIR